MTLRRPNIKFKPVIKLIACNVVSGLRSSDFNNNAPQLQGIYYATGVYNIVGNSFYYSASINVPR